MNPTANPSSLQQAAKLQTSANRFQALSSASARTIARQALEKAVAQNR